MRPSVETLKFMSEYQLIHHSNEGRKDGTAVDSGDDGILLKMLSPWSAASR